MNETEEMRDSAQAAQELTEALAENDRAVREFLSRAGQVHSAYTLALTGVREQLYALERFFQGAAAAAMGAFSNLLGALRPALTGAARAITGLFGVTYWKDSSKGMDAAAASLGRVARSTRSVAQAQRDLYSFDKITRVSARGGGSSGSSGGSGRSGGGKSAVSGEWVRVPGLLDEIAAKARSVLGQVWEPFQQAWKRQGKATVDAVLGALAGVGGAVAAVGESWLRAWRSGAGVQAVTTVLLTVQYLGESVKAVADNFKKAWQAGGAGDSIMSRLLEITQSVLGAFRDMASATAVWARQLNFTGLVQGFSSVLNALAPLVELIAGALSWGYQNVLLPLAGWVIQAAAPAALRLLSEALRTFTAVLEVLKPIALFVWERLLKPMGQWSAGTIVQGLNNAAAGFGLLREAFALLPSGWSGVKEKAETAWAGIQKILTGHANTTNNQVTTAFQSLTKNATNSGSNLKNKLATVFKSISSNAKNRFSGIGGALTTPFRNGLNGVVSLANTMIQRMNSSLRLSWPAVTVAGKTVVKPGVAKLANMPTIARLAEGGITAGPAISLIGEAGREAVLPLERNTGWMDELAKRMGKGGGTTVIEVHVGSERLGRQGVDGVNDLTLRTGTCPIYV